MLQSLSRIARRCWLAAASGCMVTGFALASTPEDNPQQMEIIQSWDFGRQDDPNKEGFPRGFIRRKGPGYPAYQQVRIVPRHPEIQPQVERSRRELARLALAWKLKRAPWKVVPESIPSWIDLMFERAVIDPCLEVRINGGAVELQAPRFPIEPAFAYAFDFELQAEALHGFEASIELSIFDRQGKLLKTISSPKATGEQDWRTLEVGPLDIDDPNSAFGQLKLLVLPLPDQGFKGIARFDRIRIRKMPQLTLELNSKSHLYTESSPVEIRCQASGMVGETPVLNLSVTNHLGEVFSRQTLHIEPDTTPLPKSRAKSTKSEHLVDRKKQDWFGSAVWKLPKLPPGFYQVVCQLGDNTRYQLPRQTRFCILNPEFDGLGDARFGWSLPNVAQRIDIAELPKFLIHSGVRNVKIPIWLDPQDAVAQREFGWLIERFKSHDIGIVGVIDLPPESQKSFFQTKGELSLASVLEQDAVWINLLEPVLGRICLQIHQVQLGWDDDESLSGNERLVPKVKLFTEQLSLFGPETNLIVPWPALLQLSGQMTKLPNRFQLHSNPGLTPREIEVVHADMERSKHAYWLGLEGIDTQTYDAATCQRHLAESMIAVVANHLDKAWVSNPFDPRQGWLDDSGRPGIMLVPFRTLSRTLADSSYIGKLDFPNGSVGHQLASDSSSSIIAYASKPTEEQIYLGEKIRAFDLYGSERPIENVQTDFGPEQKIAISPNPIVLRGIDVDVAQWRKGLVVENPKLRTTSSGQERLKVRLSNPTKIRFQGTLTLVLPETLQGDKASANFSVDAGSSEVIDIPLDIRSDATHQKKMGRFIIQTRATKDVQFSVYRELQIGDDDIEFLPKAEFDSLGNLSVVLELLNHTGQPVSFDCFLMTGDRPRERTQMIRCGERASQVIGLLKAENLQGSTLWLKCEQIGEDRVINKRFEVPPYTPPSR